MAQIQLWRPTCPGCRKIIGPLQEAYDQLINEGISRPEALTQLGITRPCCRVQVFNPPILPTGRGSPYQLIREELPQAHLASRQITPHSTLPISGVLQNMARPCRPIEAPTIPVEGLTNREEREGETLVPLTVGGVPIPAEARPRVFPAI